MFVKVIIALAAAILVCALSAGSEALARGGRAAHGRGSITSSWHWRGAGWQKARGKSEHGARFSGEKHRSHELPAIGHHRRQTSISQGQWHSSAGFGSHEHKWSNIPGAWHESPGFGSQDHGQKSTDFHRKWQAGGNGGDEDSCQNSAACQGVWREAPEP